MEEDCRALVARWRAATGIDFSDAEYPEPAAGEPDGLGGELTQLYRAFREEAETAA